MFGFLRNQSRAGSRTSSPSRRGPRIYINVPSYGGVFMTRTAPDADQGAIACPADIDTRGRELHGEVEIDLPRGSGRRRCRAVRVTLRNVSRIHMGEERGWEEDVLFERTLEVKGAIVLDEGVTRFSFTIVVPWSLAPYDVHPMGSINTTIHAEVEGLAGKTRKTPSPGSSMVNTPSGTPRRGRSPVRQRSAVLSEGPGSSGSATPAEGSGDGINAPGTDEILSQMLVSWSDPLSAAADEPEVKWLSGTVKTSRSITLLYNPNPSNGVSTLDERRRGDVEGLGPFEVRYLSQVWTVCALMNIMLNFSCPDPKTTIYYARVSMAQRVKTMSPRDDPFTTEPRISNTMFPLWEKGIKPPPQRPTAHTPAVWRGVEAGGKDVSGFTFIGSARLPTDETGRPSTLPLVQTPMSTSHSIILQVFYSVYGEDVLGNKLPTPAHGHLRLLKVDKPVMIPSCAFIPDVVDLPSYESHSFSSEACKVCGTPAAEQLCRLCTSSVPHVRHDHPPKKVGNENGICPDCEYRFVTDDVKNKWADCACGLSLQALEARMRGVNLEDAGVEPATNEHKEEERRGRGLTMDGGSNWSRMSMPAGRNGSASASGTDTPSSSTAAPPGNMGRDTTPGGSTSGASTPSESTPGANTPAGSISRATGFSDAPPAYV
ncbi:hypothetical protein CspeluHIS016_0100520 [Cutaneotrichosporon spelunceum]|uniref:Arrestin-like N-terminal domain-containing protein n=1 Tax=Cutaneotrichosporon spelunceum TaxID=1672016 RepID=A0AAD3Y7F8_9TREE|nr:hypothetical protein CspeluHIS016_0100520 [Cutaneotrichosporon spelunceum]